MMKKLAFLLFLSQLGMISLCYADIPETFIIKTDLEMKNGRTTSGFLESSGYGGCVKKGNQYVVRGDNFEKVVLNDEAFLKRFIKKGADEEVALFQKIYSIAYIPEKRDKICCDGADYLLEKRTSFTATLESERIKVNLATVKKAHIVSCQVIGVAPVVVLNKKELTLLQKPAIALFVDENYSTCGHISLASYNSQWDTPQKLQTLFKKYLSDQKILQPEGADAPWWRGICEHYYDHFRKEFLPKNIVLLIYQVTD
ncbi:MAG: hypothetical protein HY466_07045 [Deltaproteobacteria bacterium]|nr:hypothetical protein [Deltaproteobacteria bacterium]